MVVGSYVFSLNTQRGRLSGGKRRGIQFLGRFVSVLCYQHTSGGEQTEGEGAALQPSEGDPVTEMTGGEAWCIT